LNNLEIFIRCACAIGVIIITARLTGSLMVYIKQPRVVGEMIAGVLLGPTCFSSLFPEITAYLFTDTQPFIYVLGSLGLSFYMFLVGMEIDFSKVSKAITKQAYLLSTIATVVPFAGGCFCAFIYFDELSTGSVTLNSFMLYMGTAFSIMAFPMLARILDEKNLIKTKIGSLALLSASIQDVATWILLAFIVAIASTGSMINGLITLGGALCFILIAFYLGKPLLKKLGDRTEEKKSLSPNGFALVVLSLLAAAIITDKIGLFSVFGGFILGLAMPRGPVFQKEVKAKLQDFMVVFMLPLFFAYSGLKTNFLALSAANLLVPTIVILLFSLATKYVPVLLSMKASGYGWRESSAIGGLITARGLMELILANIGLEYKIIDEKVYSILILIAVISTLCAMPIYNMSLGKKDSQSSFQ